MSDEDEPRRKRFKVEDRKTDIFDLVKKHYYKNCTVAEMYRLIYRSMGLHHVPSQKNKKCPIPSIEDASRFIQRFLDKDPKMHEDFDDNHIDLISMIFKYVSIIQKTVYHGGDYKDYGLECLNSRYGIKYELRGANLASLILFDSFHGQKRKFLIIDTNFGFYSKFQYEFHYYHLFPDRVLFWRHIDDSPYNDYYLLKLDFNSNKCHILDHKAIKFPELKIMFDMSNKNEFLLAYMTNNDNCSSILKGHLHNDKIEIEENESEPLSFSEVKNFVGRGFQEEGFVFMDQKLRFLQREHEDPDENTHIRTMSYHEIDLSKNEDGSNSRKFNFDVDEDNDEVIFYLSPHIKHFAWTSTKVFNSRVFIYGEGAVLSQVYVFDLITKKCERVNFLYKMSRETAFSVEDDVLVVNDKDTIYRYSMRRPETLQNLAWFKIRQHTFIHKKHGLYKQALKQLPLNSQMQPFSFN